MANKKPKPEVQEKAPDFDAKFRNLPEGRALEAEYAKLMAMGKQALPDAEAEYDKLEGEMEKTYDHAEAAVKRLAKRFQPFYPEDLDGLDLPFAASVIAQARGKRYKEGGDESKTANGVSQKFPSELETLEVKALKLCKLYLQAHDNAHRVYGEIRKLKQNINPNEFERRRIEKGRRRRREKRSKKRA